MRPQRESLKSRAARAALNPRQSLPEPGRRARALKGLANGAGLGRQMGFELPHGLQVAAVPLTVVAGQQGPEPLQTRPQTLVETDLVAVVLTVTQPGFGVINEAAATASDNLVAPPVVAGQVELLRAQHQAQGLGIEHQGICPRHALHHGVGKAGGTRVQRRQTERLVVHVHHQGSRTVGRRQPRRDMTHCGNGTRQFVVMPDVVLVAKRHPFTVLHAR